MHATYPGAAKVRKEWLRLDLRRFGNSLSKEAYVVCGWALALRYVTVVLSIQKKRKDKKKRKKKKITYHNTDVMLIYVIREESRSSY
jgi:hypothetical protein